MRAILFVVSASLLAAVSVATIPAAAANIPPVCTVQVDTGGDNDCYYCAYTVQVNVVGDNKCHGSCTYTVQIDVIGDNSCEG